MPASNPLWRMPLLRIVLPFVVGILCAQLCHSNAWWPAVVSAFAGVLLYVLLRFTARSPMAAINRRPYYIFSIILLGFACGWADVVAQRPATINLQSVNWHPVSAQIEEISYRDFSMSMVVTLHHSQQAGNLRPVKVLLTTRGCNYSLHPGDFIAFPAQIEPLRNAGNPDEIDYKSIMERRGIVYTEHLAVSKLKCYAHGPGWLHRLAMLRFRMQTDVFNSNLSAQAQDMVVAIILGNSTFIDSDTREAFSSAGISHILALSGLHVGIVGSIIWLLFWPLDIAGGRKLRYAITIVALVAFAVFTGLSPSVVRATVMMGFVLTAYIFYRKSDPLNALLAAALLILAFSPLAIFDVGFQLSFITVASLLIFASKTGVIQFRNRLWRYVGTLAITSVIAMLATIMLTAYYFHTMSLVSVFVNMLVLPVMPLLMAFAALLVVSLSAGIALPLVESATDGLASYIHWIAGFTQSVEASHLSGMSPSGLDVLAYYVILLLLILWFKRKWAWCMISSIALLAMVLSIDAIEEFQRPKSGFLMLNDYDATVVVQYRGDEALVWCPDADEGEYELEQFERRYRGFLAHNGISKITMAGHEPLRTNGAFVRTPHAFMGGHSLLAVGYGGWKTATNASGLRPDFVIVTKMYHSSASNIYHLYHPKLLILSGDIYAPTEHDLWHECKRQGIPCWSLRRNGAYFSLPAASK